MLNGPSSETSRPLNRIVRLAALTALLGLGLSQVSLADDHPATKRTIAEQFIHDMKEGKIAAAGADDHVVQELIIKRSIPITYKYINILMSTGVPKSEKKSASPPAIRISFITSLPFHFLLILSCSTARQSRRPRVPGDLTGMLCRGPHRHD